MSPFRPDRSRRGPDPLLGPKMLLFVAGAVLALIGMAAESTWLVLAGAAALAGGLVLRFLGRTPHDREPDAVEDDDDFDDNYGDLEDPGDLDELDDAGDFDETGNFDDADDSDHQNPPPPPRRMTGG